MEENKVWHYEANDIQLFDGSLVEKWMEKGFDSPNFHQRHSSKKPIFRENVKNGNDALEFRSNYGQFLDTDGLGDEVFNGVDEITSITVSKANGSVKDNHTFQSWEFNNNGDPLWEQKLGSTNFLSLRKTEDGGEYRSSIVADRKLISNWSIHISVLSKYKLQHYTNGKKGLEVSGEFIDHYEHYKSRIGATRRGQQDVLDGYIAEVIAYDKVLTEGELDQIQNDLSKKYNITVKSIS